MIQTSRIQLKTTDEFNNKVILDVISRDSRFYILYKDLTLSEFELSGILVHTVELNNLSIKPNIIYIDELYVYIGYENGTTEVRDLQDNLSYLKTTSIKDPGGPGSPHITAMLATQDFFLVNTVENGLLIYIKPSIIFYKWIMIELETTITSFAINNHLLFVLTKDNEIHQLNFIEQRLDEVPIGGFEYVDIEFDGRFLYLASKQSLHVYDYNNNNQLVFSHKFKTKQITLLAKFHGKLLIILNENYLTILRIDQSYTNPNFTIDSAIKQNHPMAIQFYETIKTHCTNNIEDDNKFVWVKGNEVYVSSITA
ncbi:MAG: hypothetical protein GPJ54_09740 [Candidatus Heimdallarchaeota archaeon]|nr:hypothetical protein [Candidatus Heimdallarchaeota archaeon]